MLFSAVLGHRVPTAIPAARIAIAVRIAVRIPDRVRAALKVEPEHRGHDARDVIAA